MDLNSYRKFYIESCDDVSESELDFEKDLVFKSKPLFENRRKRHDFYLKLWKEYFMNMLF